MLIISRHFGNLLYICSYYKNDSCFKHVQYICIDKLIKNEINYCVPPTSSPISNFQGVISVQQLSANLMMLEYNHFTEILEHQNGLKQTDVEHSFIHFVLGVLGACNMWHNNSLTRDAIPFSGCALCRAVFGGPFDTKFLTI